jgi:trk system potassium uptake protein TrkA
VHIVILGCGRVGSLLAHRLDDMGHSVAIVDQDPGAFRKLGTEFTGQTVTGVGFDRETLETADILAARVARETYGVEQVVARIYDPRRAEVYQRLGIPTVATVSWSTNQIMRSILPLGAQDEYVDASSSVVLAEVHVGTVWFGRSATTLEHASGARIAFITRYGQAFIPNSESVLQEGDLVHALFASDSREAVEAVFERGPQEG